MSIHHKPFPEDIVQYLMKQMAHNGWRQTEPLDDYMPIKHPKALKQAINLILLNDVLTGSQLLREIKKDGITLSKTIVDEVLNLDPDTIVEDVDMLTNTSFAQLKIISSNT